MDTVGPFLGGKERPGRDSDHVPPSSSEVMNEYILVCTVLFNKLKLKQSHYTPQRRLGGKEV
jgi:hypothetical protein